MAKISRIYAQLPPGYVVALARLVLRDSPASLNLSAYVAKVLYQHIQEKIKRKQIPIPSEEDMQLESGRSPGQILRHLRQNGP